MFSNTFFPAVSQGFFLAENLKKLPIQLISTTHSRAHCGPGFHRHFYEPIEIPKATPVRPKQLCLRRALSWSRVIIMTHVYAIFCSNILS